jgi:Domain of unknown function (DUF1854)
VRNITIRYVDPRSVRAWRPEGSTHLRVELADDQTILSARVKRAFPTSNPREFLSLQDGKGHEVGVLRNLEGMEHETALRFDEELERRYFTPAIRAIKELRQEAGMWKFVVDTQRGPTDFFVRNWRDSAFEVSVNRWLIQTVDGARFEIKDVEALDAKSRKLLDLLL